MKLIKKNQVEIRDFGKGLTLQILLDKIEGAINLDLGTVSIPPKSQTGMHSRKDFEEVIYMLSGTGQVITEDGLAYTLETGDCILIPQGVVHCHANNSDSSLEQLYIFAPQASAEIEESLRNLPILK